MFLRRLALAALFALSLAPALAQAPPPVPALPDTERRTSYSLSASTCACSVGFALYGDSTDFQDWVEVWLNGALVPYNSTTSAWTITSPTGPLATIPRPITDGVLTFAAPQTGTVQIVGARRPRRTSQFSENRGVAARDFNQAVTDIVATLRENWDRTNDLTGRGLFSQPGVTIGPMPQPAACASSYLAFDATGKAPVCLPTGGAVFAPTTACVQDFLAGVGFTAGATTSLTTTCALGTSQALLAIYFDGVYQNANTWSLAGVTATFNAPIPLSVQVVEFKAGIPSTAPATPFAGPNSSVDSDIAVFNGTNGNVVKDGGATIASLIVPVQPGGRLTAQQGVPVQSAEKVGVSTLYYAPYPGHGSGDEINIGGKNYPINATPTDANGQSLTLGTYVSAGNIYGLFDIVVAGAPQLCVGPAWSTPPTIGTTAGVESAAGATGVYHPYGGTIVNVAVAAMPCTYGAGAGTVANVAQYQGTEVGLIYGAGSGTVSVQIQPPSATGGSNPVMGMCNNYNQEPILIFEEDSTASFTNNQPGYEFEDLNYNNSITWLQCPNPKKVTAVYDANQAWNAGGGAQAITIGIGWNMALSGLAAGFTGAAGGGACLGQVANTAAGNGGMLYGCYSAFPNVGLNRVSALEQSTATGTTVFYHDFASLQLKGFY